MIWIDRERRLGAEGVNNNALCLAAVWAFPAAPNPPYAVSSMERALVATGPVYVFERPERDAPLVTEMVVGEHLEALDERDGWLRVIVPGHATPWRPDPCPSRRWPGGSKTIRRKLDAVRWPENRRLCRLLKA